MFRLPLHILSGGTSLINWSVHNQSSMKQCVKSGDMMFAISKELEQDTGGAFVRCRVVGLLCRFYLFLDFYYWNQLISKA